MTRKEKLALIAAVYMAGKNGQGRSAKDAVSIADYLLTETELAVECHIPN
jgi:hypothetical protein